MAAKNPFGDFDFAKMFQSNPFFTDDYRKAMEDISRSFSGNLGGLSQAGFDMEGFLAAQRKNVEALTQANKLAAEGMQAVARRQSEIFRESMEEALAATRQLMSTGAPDARAAYQSEILKEAFERAVTHMKELSEMVAKSNAEAFDVVNARVSESLEEIKALAEKGGKTRK